MCDIVCHDVCPLSRGLGNVPPRPFGHSRRGSSAGAARRDRRSTSAPVIRVESQDRGGAASVWLGAPSVSLGATGVWAGAPHGYQCRARGAPGQTEGAPGLTEGAPPGASGAPGLSSGAPVLTEGAHAQTGAAPDSSPRSVRLRWATPTGVSGLRLGCRARPGSMDLHRRDACATGTGRVHSADSGIFARAAALPASGPPIRTSSATLVTPRSTFSAPSATMVRNPASSR